jgi:trehalose transport system permease protein
MYDRLNQSKIKRVGSAPLTTSAIGLILLFTGIPIYLMVKLTFADPGTFINLGEFRFSLENLKAVIVSGNIWAPLRKSLVVALATSFLSVFIAAPGAYVLAKIPGRTGYVFLILIFFTRMFPEVGIALPISLNVIRLGLFDTDLGLILAHLIRVLPLVTWILIGTFKAVPKDLEEAGRMDGCSKLQVFYKVVLPVAKPGIIVGLIFGFLNSWDEFTYATYLCLQDKTLPLTVYYYVNRGGWFLSSTYALVVTLPVVIFTYYFQRYLQSGYLSGAVKG